MAKGRASRARTSARPSGVIRKNIKAYKVNRQAGDVAIPTRKKLKR